jgi:hypothetical protein
MKQSIEKHNRLFFSPVLKRWALPFFTPSRGIAKPPSVGSVCNTHTKPWFPGVNEQKVQCLKGGF